MNRTIKFRGKSIYDEEWLYGFLVKIEKDRYAVIPPLNDIDIEKSIGMYEVCLETIGQFTGLYDKNGKEIYEGDIVEWLFFSYDCHGEQVYYLKGYIEWHQGGLIFNVTEKDFEDAGFYAISDLHTDTESDVKILGNIYDNPDLIKKE